MRWNDLFADLEGQFAAAADADFVAEVAERTRSERASVEFASRLCAGLGSDVAVVVSDAQTVRGELVDVASTWILLRTSARDVLVPLGAVVNVTGLPGRAEPLSRVARRLSIGHALRALARARAAVVITTRGGQWSGVISQVGADYLEVRGGEGGGVAAIPFAGIQSVAAIGAAGG